MIKHAILIALLGAGTGSCEFSTHATNGAPIPESAPVAAATIGAAAPAFSLPDQSGKQVSLADFAGRVVVLEWVNPDCPFVKRHYQAKTMSELASKYQD